MSYLLPLLAALTACGDGSAILRVDADPALRARLDALAITLWSADTPFAVTLPIEADASYPLSIRVERGETFRGEVIAEVIGEEAGVPLARDEVPLDLAASIVVDVVLSPVASAPSSERDLDPGAGDGRGAPVVDGPIAPPVDEGQPPPAAPAPDEPPADQPPADDAPPVDTLPPVEPPAPEPPAETPPALELCPTPVSTEQARVPAAPYERVRIVVGTTALVVVADDDLGDVVVEGASVPTAFGAGDRLELTNLGEAPARVRVPAALAVEVTATAAVCVVGTRADVDVSTYGPIEAHPFFADDPRVNLETRQATVRVSIATDEATSVSGFFDAVDASGAAWDGDVLGSGAENGHLHVRTDGTLQLRGRAP